MAGTRAEAAHRRGQIRYQERSLELNSPHEPLLFHQIRPRYFRPSVVTVSRINSLSESEAKTRPPAEAYIITKLAGSREQAFRFLRSVIAQHSASPKAEGNSASRRGSKADESEGEVMPPADFLRGGARGGRGTTSPLIRPVTSDTFRNNSTASASTLSSGLGLATGTGSIPEDKPLAGSNGVSIGVNLTEPLLFLQGHDQNDTTSRSTVMLRGSLHLKVLKSAKIKAVTLKFKGTATTRWPEGIPPKKTDFEETDTIMSHTWPFFNAQFPNAEGGSCADHVRLANKGPHGVPYLNSSPSHSSVNLHSRDQKRLSLATVQSKSADKTDAKAAPSVAQRGYRTFQPGDYIYNFELPLDSRLPETIDVDLGVVKYELEASVERAGAFRANLTGIKPVTLIRAPTEGSLEQVEPIAISRNWEDQLHYDIVISGKSFPLGSKIPIAFKLTPLAKVQCHRIKVFVTENIEYFCSGKRVHRLEPTKKVLLYERRADGTNTSTFPGSTQRITAGGGIPYSHREAAARGEDVVPQDTSNLLGHLENEPNIGPTEMEFSVQMPGCQLNSEKERQNKLHFDTTYQNIQVHHWIKIVMRLSRPDNNGTGKRRHFEISIDSPLHILSCQASQANISLPAYSSPENGPRSTQGIAECGCPGALPRRNSPNYSNTVDGLNASGVSTDGTADLPRARLRNNSGSEARPPSPSGPPLARPPAAHVANHVGGPVTSGHQHRPMHMLRAPSFQPPSFDAEPPPPPLTTPPPQYNDIASPTVGHGLADYFSRFESTYGEGSESDDEDGRSSIRGRVTLPLTPGGRVNRSMDLGYREWTDLSAGGR